MVFIKSIGYSDLIVEEGIVGRGERICVKWIVFIVVPPLSPHKRRLSKYMIFQTLFQTT